MEFLPHQITTAKKALSILSDLGVVYINGQPRSGKTATALRVAETAKLDRWLILTKKNAIEGWTKFIEDTELNLSKSYHVINYEQVGKLKDNKATLKVNPKNYDGVILDEGHNYGAFPKPSNRVKLTRLLAYQLPLIVLSGTPIVESANTIYHQLWISKYSPFKFKNFYDFFRVYGKPYFIRAGGRDINQYDRFKPELLKEIEKFTVYMSQEDAGINIQVQDELHYVTLSKEHTYLYNELQKHQLVNFTSPKHNFTLVCDSVMKLRTSLHMLESGVIKVEDTYYDLGYDTKIQYILDNFGDTKDVGIMCHFIGERNKLENYFNHASIYSSNAHAEGVDLSHLKHFIILSSDYSGAKFIQRRERIANINGSNSTTVHHILVKGAISEQVYKTTSNKRDFNNKVFRPTDI